MSDQPTTRGRDVRQRWRPRVGPGLIALAAALAPAAALAVVGGVTDDGPSSRAAVMVLNSNAGLCSAVVVARDVLLTAAHCVTRATEHRVHWRDESGRPVLVEPAAKLIHPDYDAGAIQGRRRSVDLALVRLPGSLPDRFEPARLSSGAAALGASLTLGGYGLAQEGEARPTGTFRTASLQAVEPHGPSRLLVWARGAKGVGACEGDSGGPIALGDLVFAETTWSTGLKGRRCGDISQGVLLGPQRAWIDATLARWGRSARWN